VLRARLSDAKFFWDQDRKTTLLNAGAALDSVVFHAKLGTMAQGRAPRNARGEIAPLIGADAAKAKRAARLCKADLVVRHGRRVPRAAGRHGSLLRA
jgi:glycyl-tRNA synthetase beta chain